MDGYHGQYYGNEIDEAVGKALNPDTTPTADSTALITSGAVHAAVGAGVAVIEYTSDAQALWTAVNSAFAAKKAVFIRVPSGVVSVGGVTYLMLFSLVRYFAYPVNLNTERYRYDFNGVFDSDTVFTFGVSKSRNWSTMAESYTIHDFAVTDQATKSYVDTGLAGKQDTLTFDDAPAEGSDNPVKSGGIYDAIQAGGATALGAYPTDTITDADIASFSDGADNIPVKSAAFSILPVQNLNGYEYPWPAGGGKNKVGKSDGNTGTLTRSGVTFKFEDDGSVTLSGTATAAIYPCLFDSTGATIASNSGWHGASSRMPLTSGTYKFTATITGTGLTASSVTLAAYDGETQRLINGAAAANTIDGVNSVFLAIANGTAFSNCNIKWQLEAGSTATDYAPYSNVCPISGWSGANITRTGKNLFGGEPLGDAIYAHATGSIDKTAKTVTFTHGDGSKLDFNVKWQPNTQYTFLFTIASYSAQNTSMRVWYTDGTKASISFNNLSAGSIVRYVTAANKTVDGVYLEWFATGSVGIYYEKSGVFEGSVNTTDLEPYNGSTIILDIGINQWDEEWELGGIVWNTGEEVAGTDRIRTGFIKVTPNSSFYVHVSSAITSFTQGGVVYYDGSQNWVGMVNAQPFNKAYTAPSNARYMRFVFQGVTTYSSGISINSPSYITGYYPYTGRNPVYAGTITALGGGQWKIQPTQKLVTINDIGWQYSSNLHIFYAEVTEMATAQDVIASCYKYIGAKTDAQMSSADDYSIAVGPSSPYLKIKDTRYTTAVSLKADMGAETILYPLATLPDPIILSADDLVTLLGSNSIFADVGSMAELTYRADTTLYIQKLINGGTISTLSMASPTPTLTLDRPDTLTLGDFVSFPSASEPDVVADEPADEPSEEDDTEEATEE